MRRRDAAFLVEGDRHRSDQDQAGRTGEDVFLARLEDEHQGRLEIALLHSAGLGPGAEVAAAGHQEPAFGMGVRMVAQAHSVALDREALAFHQGGKAVWPEGDQVSPLVAVLISHRENPHSRLLCKAARKLAALFYSIIILF